MAKKNSVLKNIGIVMKAWIKRYPSALLTIPIYLACRLLTPFWGTLLSSKAIGAITEGNVKRFVILIAEILLVITICTATSQFLDRILNSQKLFTRVNEFSTTVLKKAMYTDFKNIELHQNRKIMVKAVNSIEVGRCGPEGLMDATINIAIVLLGIGTYGTVIMMIDWKILVIILCMFVGNVTLQTHAVRYGDRHREEGSEIWRKKRYIKKKSLNISAGKDIRIFQLKGWFHELLDDVVKRRREHTRKLSLRWYFGTISDVSFNFLRDWVAYTILIKRVLTGQIDIAEFTLYLGLISGFSNWIYSLSANYSNLKKSSHEFNDYFDFLNQPERTVQPGSENPLEKEKHYEAPSIEFRNVNFTYEGSEKATINDLSFTIKAGEKIALVGNNGAGKTTIVKLLTGLYEKSDGVILVNGKLIETIPLEDYQNNISVLFQDTNPFAFSLAENVSGKTIDETNTIKVIDSLKKAGLLEKVNSLPKRENTYLTQNLDDEGVLLSGGETQKLLLAKAIYKNGNFLILDEPTSALDPIAESKIYEEYNELSTGKTAVFISHRLASTKFCDKIFFLENGHIVEMGTHDELILLGGKYKEMFDLQSQYYS